jgi:hypothetical protein
MHAYTRAQRQALASYAFVVVTDGNVIHFTISRQIYIIFVFLFLCFEVRRLEGILGMTSASYAD